jgi:hypothetical protein
MVITFKDFENTKWNFQEKSVNKFTVFCDFFKFSNVQIYLEFYFYKIAYEMTFKMSQTICFYTIKGRWDIRKIQKTTEKVCTTESECFFGPCFWKTAYAVYHF